MKRPTPTLLFLVFATGLALGALLFRGNSDAVGLGENPDASAISKAIEPQIWTCSMHPQIQQPGPGKCPICAMDLIPTADPTTSRNTDHPGYAMTTEAAARARIATSTISRGNPEVTVRLFGKIAYDETLTRTVAARFPSRIERLFVDYTGIRVARGDHLAALYSPELLAAQTELLGALDSGRDDRAKITREKLRRWGLTTADISAIETAGTPSEELVISSPSGGVVIHLGVEEGRYVQTGTPLFRVGSTEVLWVLLDAYESDLQWLRYGQEITFQAEALPGRDYSARISFLAPELDPATRTVPVRVTIKNTDGFLRPGMFVRAKVRARAAEGGLIHDPDLAGKWISPMHPEIVRDGPGQCDVCGMDLVPAASLGYQPADTTTKPPLLLPASAVLHTGKRSIVYLAEPDKTGNETLYTGREVELGARAGDFYIVTSGLSEADKVVTEGAFKIDSALQILARPSMMNPTAAPEEQEALRLDTPFRRALDPFLQYYFAVQEGLAADSLAPARSAATELTHVLHKISPSDGPDDWETSGNLIAEAAVNISGAADLAAARLGFEELSIAFLHLAEARHLAPREGAHLVLCPMAFEDRGARWLQRPGPVNNPYHGAEMLLCGEVEEEIPPRSPVKESGHAQPHAH